MSTQIVVLRPGPLTLVDDFPDDGQDAIPTLVGDASDALADDDDATYVQFTGWQSYSGRAFATYPALAASRRWRLVRCQVDVRGAAFSPDDPRFAVYGISGVGGDSSQWVGEFHPADSNEDLVPVAPMSTWVENPSGLTTEQNLVDGHRAAVVWGERRAWHLPGIINVDAGGIGTLGGARVSEVTVTFTFDEGRTPLRGRQRSSGAMGTPLRGRATTPYGLRGMQDPNR